ncbi:MAG TPA: 3-hydroxyacyl-CoA dehydrogenase family protein [Beijerinckiaceae bacterium]|jgi:3-hydroxybutyryl-CoA dehydrogenase
MTGRARIGIIGAGLMGHGIAQVFAAAGHEVAITDPVAAARESARAKVARNLADMGLDPAAAERVSPRDDVAAAVADADVVIEAAPEKMELKQALFAEIEAAAPAHAILASNTSVMPITQIMSRLRDKSRALGTHWWNPPYLVPLVEVVRTADTSDAAVTRMIDLLTAVGKTAVDVKKDVPGFVGNRLQHALWREAISIVEQGICDARTVDAVVKASFGRRLAVLGPLENADMVGTDLTLAIHEQVLPYIENRAGPSPLLESMVAEGRLGFKSGEGFRTWTAEEQDALRAAVMTHLLRLNQTLK